MTGIFQASTVAVMPAAFPQAFGKMFIFQTHHEFEHPVGVGCFKNSVLRKTV
jgi:hypothetical protein